MCCITLRIKKVVFHHHHFHRWSKILRQDIHRSRPTGTNANLLHQLPQGRLKYWRNLSSYIFLKWVPFECKSHFYLERCYILVFPYCLFTLPQGECSKNLEWITRRKPNKWFHAMAFKVLWYSVISLAQRGLFHFVLKIVFNH